MWHWMLKACGKALRQDFWTFSRDVAATVIERTYSARVWDPTMELEAD